MLVQDVPRGRRGAGRRGAAAGVAAVRAALPPRRAAPRRLLLRRARAPPTAPTETQVRILTTIVHGILYLSFPILVLLKLFVLIPQTILTKPK